MRARMLHAARASVVVTVLVGILLMHSISVEHSAEGHPPNTIHTASDSPALFYPAAVDNPFSDEAECGSPCPVHSGMHSSLVVMTVVVALAGARMLLDQTAWARWPDRVQRQSIIWKGSTRPQTTLSLEQLSVLRV